MTLGKEWPNVSTVNEIIKWNANFDQMDAVYNETGHTVTLYACFQSRVDKDYNLVYIGLTTTVLDKPEVTFGEKIKEYWYPGDQAEVAKRDTVRMNVPRPTSAGITNRDVFEYAKDLDDNFKGNKVVMTPTSAEQMQHMIWQNWELTIITNLQLNSLRLVSISYLVMLLILQDW